MVKLVRPNTRYRRSYFSALREYIRSGKNPRELAILQMTPQDAMKDFPRLARRIRGFAQGRDLPKGFIPSSTFWLVEATKYLGWLNIRHRFTPLLRHEMGLIGYEIRPSERGKGYGTLILKLALPKARKIGLRKMLVTCDSGNYISRKVIEKNGGIFEKKVRSRVEKGWKLKYWIRL